jgi:hypothetical protein
MRVQTTLFECDLCHAIELPNGPEAPTELPHGWMAMGDDDYHLCPKCTVSVYLALKQQGGGDTDGD